MKNKFKAWIDKENRFADSVTVFSDGSWSAKISGVDGYDEKDGGVLLPYIGRLDENNIEIYVGDIVETVKQTISREDILRYGIIQYDEQYCCYMIDFPQYGESVSLLSFIDLGLKIIGNEFENMDLLEM